MEVKDVLFMNKGEGEGSYAQHGVFAQKVTAASKAVLENAVESLFSTAFNSHRPHQLLNVADLGCSAGPTTFHVISTIKAAVERKCREMNYQTPPELQIYLNDLPGNDFNALSKGIARFRDKQDGVLCLVMATPASFHGRLFPRNSLHLVHSCYSVHWLSQVPKGLMTSNKGKIYISKTSPPAVREAYLSQFQQDLAVFLSHRSEEMAPNGRMVLVLHGRQSPDPSSMECCYAWELIAKAIKELVLKGLIDEEKLDSFNVPYYTPSIEEVENIVKREGSFAIEHMDSFALDIANKEEKDGWARGEKVAKNIRSFTEPIIAYQFGAEIMEQLYHELTHLVVEELTKGSIAGISLVVVLTKYNDFDNQ